VNEWVEDTAASRSCLHMAAGGITRYQTVKLALFQGQAVLEEVSDSILLGEDQRIR